MSTPKFIYALCLGATMLLAQSCASIVTRTNYPVTFQSQPSEASVRVADNKGVVLFSGRTPAIVTLRAGSGFFTKATYTVEYSKPGYETVTVPLTAKLEGWYFGNILLGGVIGMLIIDPATGAMWRLDNGVFQELNPLLESVSSTFQIIDINDVPENMKEMLVAIE